jgi:hypothetical protein
MIEAGGLLGEEEAVVAPTCLPRCREFDFPSGRVMLGKSEAGMDGRK